MAYSTKTTARSRNTAGRLDHEALLAGSTKTTSGPRQAAEPSEHGSSNVQRGEDLEAFVQANEAIMKGMAALNSEVLAFGNKRARENLERSESLAGCGDVEQALRIQWEFLESATQQYLDQTNNLLAIMAKAAGDFWTPLQEHTRESLRAWDTETR